jgi:TPR repeat protein
MFCTKCGNQIKDGFKFCPKCGTPVYVEKEVPQSEVKTQVEDVKNETSKKETEPKQDVYVKDAAKSKATSSSQKTSTTPSINKDYIPNPLIELELDIEGVKKMAEKGNKIAMLRQAFRFEMGIGVEKNIEKSEKLYSQAGGKNSVPELEEILRPTIIPSNH